MWGVLHLPPPPSKKKCIMITPCKSENNSVFSDYLDMKYLAAFLMALISFYVSANPANIFVVLSSSPRQGLHSTTASFSDIEYHFVAITEELHKRKISYLVIVPRFAQKSFKPYHYVRPINTAMSPTNVDDIYVDEVKKILSNLQPRPDIFWTFGEWTVDAFQDIGIPTIVSDSGGGEYCYTKSLPTLWFRYVTKFAYIRCASSNNSVSFSLHEGLNYEEFECNQQNKTNKILYVTDNLLSITTDATRLAEYNPDKIITIVSLFLPIPKDKRIISSKYPNIKFHGRLPKYNHHHIRSDLMKSSSFIYLNLFNISYHRLILEGLSKCTPMIYSNPLLNEFIHPSYTGILGNNITQISSYNMKNINNFHSYHYISQNFNISMEVDRLLIASLALIKGQNPPNFYFSASELQTIKNNNKNSIQSSSLTIQYNNPSVTNDENILIVGSMTTAPLRLSKANTSFGVCIYNLLSMSQLDRLYLNIPWAYGIRHKSNNVTIPEELLAIERKSAGKLRIIRCKDYGPSTKLLPVLQLPDSELSPNSMIITFDDDRIYTKEAIAALVNTARAKPNAVITIASWMVDIFSANGLRGKRGGPTFYSRVPSREAGLQYVKEGYVDIILGFFGVLYRKKFFQYETEIFNYAADPRFSAHCAWVDDVWFSGHLERLGIPKYVIGNVPHTRADVTELTNIQALSLDHGVSIKQNHDNVLCAEAMRSRYGIWNKKRRNLREMKLANSKWEDFWTFLFKLFYVI